MFAGLVNLDWVFNLL